MNELLFALHCGLVVIFVLIALRIGKEALIGWVAVQALLANLLVTKQITLFGCNATGSDVFAVGSILTLNLLQEYYGKQQAKKAVWLTFLAMAFLAVMSQIHLLYHPSSYDTAQEAFVKIFSAAPRLLFASLAVSFLVQQIDIRIFGFLKRKLSKTALPWRNAISLTLSQLLDTVLFTLIGLYGLVDSLFEIIVISFILKMVVISVLSPLTAFSKRLLPDEISKV